MDEPLITAMLASMPPYICRCGHEMGVPIDPARGACDWLTDKANGRTPDMGCQPGHCKRLPPEPERPVVCSDCRVQLAESAAAFYASEAAQGHRCGDKP